MSKREPELDLLLKYGAQWLSKRTEKIVGDIFGETEPEKAEAPTNKPSPDKCPPAVQARIARAIRAHLVSSQVGTMSTCKCGERSNELGHVNHVTQAVIDELTRPDPAVGWWRDVTDTP